MYVHLKKRFQNLPNVSKFLKSLVVTVKNCDYSSVVRFLRVFSQCCTLWFDVLHNSCLSFSGACSSLPSAVLISSRIHLLSHVTWDTRVQIKLKICFMSVVLNLVLNFNLRKGSIIVVMPVHSVSRWCSISG